MLLERVGIPSSSILKLANHILSKRMAKKTHILPYALNDLIDKFDLPGDILSVCVSPCGSAANSDFNSLLLILRICVICTTNM
jgi:hypothetical protein